jgi:xanthine dehydrogenase accessory factor
MNDALDALHAWLRQGSSGALATVISTWGSAPRPAGAKMAINRDGKMVGSISGGCVESAVAQAALDSLKDRRPRLLEFRVADEQAWSVGLTCGGRMEVFVEPFAQGPVREPTPAQPLAALMQAQASGQPAVRAVVIRGAETLAGVSATFGQDGESLGQDAGLVVDTLSPEARRAAETGRPSRKVFSLPQGKAEVFFDPVMPPPTLIIVGGVHVAVILARLAKVAGYRVVILDPRRSFATADRFPEADQIVVEWPDKGLRGFHLSPSTAIAALSHDPKLDDPALLLALRSRAGYVGALGSQATNTARRQRLIAGGLSEAEWGRLHAPIGIAGLGDSPEAIAVGILAEIMSRPA